MTNKKTRHEEHDLYANPDNHTVHGPARRRRNGYPSSSKHFSQLNPPPPGAAPGATPRTKPIAEERPPGS